MVFNERFSIEFVVDDVLGRIIVEEFVDDNDFIVDGTTINVCFGVNWWLDKESFKEICWVRIDWEDELSIVSNDGNGSEELTTTNWREISGEVEEVDDWEGGWITYDDVGVDEREFRTKNKIKKFVLFFLGEFFFTCWIII